MSSTLRSNSSSFGRPMSAATLSTKMLLSRRRSKSTWFTVWSLPIRKSSSSSLQLKVLQRFQLQQTCTDTRGDFRHRGCFCSRKNWKFDRRRRGPFHRQFSGHPPHDVRSRCPLLDLDSLLHHTLVTTIFHCQNGDLSTFHRSGRTILSWTTRAIRQFTAD